MVFTHVHMSSPRTVKPSNDGTRSNDVNMFG